MSACNNCKESDLDLYEIYAPSGELIFHLCFRCQLSTFVCPKCIQLRDQSEEYINGYCTYETKFYKKLNDKLIELQIRLAQLEANNI